LNLIPDKNHFWLADSRQGEFKEGIKNILNLLMAAEVLG